jgi:hypothetical protein
MTDYVVKLQVLLTPHPHARRLAVGGLASLRRQVELLYPQALYALEYTDAEGDVVALDVEQEWRALLLGHTKGDLLRLRLQPADDAIDATPAPATVPAPAPVAAAAAPAHGATLTDVVPQPLSPKVTPPAAAAATPIECPTKHKVVVAALPAAAPKAGFSFDHRWYNASLPGCEMQVKFTDERVAAEVVRDTERKKRGFMTLRAAQPLREGGATKFRMRVDKWGSPQAYLHIGLVPPEAEPAPWKGVYELPGYCISVSPMNKLHSWGQWGRGAATHGPIDVKFPADGEIEISVDFENITAQIGVFAPGAKPLILDYKFNRTEDIATELYPAVSLWNKGDAVRFVETD